MCGITGFLDTKRQTSQEQLYDTTRRMRDTLIHRGPDGADSWIDATQGIAFGHRRLAILDLSAQGQQPMHSASGRYVITFNGEIYNFQEIRKQLELENSAPIWRGHSDTEVLLAAFEAWGIEKTLKYCVGMFAIGLWDRQDKLLYLIRDRMGEKPLYYGWLKHHFVFGSELKSLKKHFAWNQEISTSSVRSLMQYNYIPAPHTIYKDIFKLEPGHYLVVHQDKNVSKHSYWKLKNFVHSRASDFTERQAIDLLESKLRDSIRQQMLADVPVGAFLSGGIDSSTIVALMQAQSRHPIKTFTIGFEDNAYDEARQAKLIASHLKTEHTELYLSPELAQTIIPSMSSFYDEPFSDSSQLPTYIVAKLAREQVTVSLSGDGGDELFGGYNRYYYAPQVWKKISLLPNIFRQLICKFIQSFPPRSWDKLFSLLGPLLPSIAQQRNPGEKLYKLARILNSSSPQEIYYKLVSHTKVEGQSRHYIELSKGIDFPSLPEEMMYIDSLTYLPDDILVKVDRAAMAVSLETRVPFLDHRVVEFAWSLPLKYKIHRGQSKWIVRQLLNRYVPEALYSRPKMGFAIPIDQWLRGPLKEWAHDLLTPSMLSKHELLDANSIQSQWKDHVSGIGNWQHQLWNVLSFQSWYEENHG